MGAQSRPKGLFSPSELGPACGPWGRGDGLHCWATQSHGFGLGLVKQAGHAHGKVADEGRPGDFHIEGHFLGFVGIVDHLAGDDTVGKARGDFAVDFQTPDGHAIDSLKWDVREVAGMGAQPGETSAPISDTGAVLYA